MLFLLSFTSLNQSAILSHRHQQIHRNVKNQSLKKIDEHTQNAKTKFAMNFLLEIVTQYLAATGVPIHNK